MSAVDALLFDLGEVIMAIDWDRAFSRWAEDSGQNVETLRSRFLRRHAGER